MGGNSSKSAVQQTSELFNKTTNSFMSSLNQTVNATGGTLQKANFSKAKFKNCRVKVTQGSEVSVTATGSLSAVNVQDLTTKLKSDATSAIDNAASQKNGFLAPGIENNVSAQSDLKTKVSNIIENTMKSDTVQTIIANAKSNQDIDSSGLKGTCDPVYRLPGEWDFEFDQKILQSVTAKGIADALTKALADDATVSSAVTNVDSSASQDNQGFNDLVDSVFNGIKNAFTGPLANIYIACVVLCCICCIGLLFFALSPAGQSAANAATKSGVRATNQLINSGAFKAAAVI